MNPALAHFRALDVVVGVRASTLANFRAFPAVSGPADVVVLETDPVLLSGEVTRAVVERTALLTVHATVVHARAGALAFPAPSGLGKSTLAVALVRAGFGLMSDELAAFDGSGSVLAFPRPVTLVDTPAGAGHGGLGREIALDVDGLGSTGPQRARVGAVIVPVRVDGAPTSLHDIAPSEAVGALIRHSFNHYRNPGESLTTVAAVAASSIALRLTYGEASDAAAVLADRFPTG